MFEALHLIILACTINGSTIADYTAKDQLACRVNLINCFEAQEKNTIIRDDFERALVPCIKSMKIENTK